MSRDVMQQMYQRLLTEPHAPKVCDELEVMLREELAKPDHIPDAGKMVEQEPFGYWHEGATEEESDFFLHSGSGNVGCSECIALYAAPPLTMRPTELAERLKQGEKWAVGQERQPQPEQEPVAIVDANDEGYWADILPDRSVKVGQLLYTALRQRQRQPLTTVEYIQALGPLMEHIECSSGTLHCIVRTIEALHGIKEQP